LLISQQKNLERATVFYLNVAERAKNGLLPGVDSTMAFAEVSRAKISLTRAKEQVKIQNNELVVLLGESPQDWVVDTNFIQNIPKVLTNAQSATDSSLQHPTRQLFESRVLRSKEQEKMFQKEAYPTLTLFGVFQTRASGFRPNYALDQTAFTHNYFTGVIPTRQNYLFGVGMVWNLTNILRTSKKVNAQKLNTEGLDEEYKAIDLELKVREDAANARIAFAIQNFKEVPLQVAAAQEAYLQRLSLYNNGLSDLTDVSTALFALNRAETDQDIISTNVWQALLIKAAATGNFDLFLNEF
jgi:outer membrane protein TolC